MSQDEPSQTHGIDSSQDQSDRGTLDVGITVVHSQFADLTPHDSSDDESSSEDGEELLELLKNLKDLKDRKHLIVAARDGVQQHGSSSTSTDRRSNILFEMLSGIETLADAAQQSDSDADPTDGSNKEASVYAWLQTKDGKLTGIPSAVDFSNTSKRRYKVDFTQRPGDVESWWSTRVLAGVKATWADRGPEEENINFVLKTQKDLVDDLEAKSKDGDHQVKFITNAYNAHVESDDEDGN